MMKKVKMYATVHFQMEVPTDMTESNLEEILNEKFKGSSDNTFKIKVSDYAGDGNQEVKLEFYSLYCSRI